jgi:hypothetical protein
MPITTKTVRMSDHEYFTVAFKDEEPISVTRSKVVWSNVIGKDETPDMPKEVRAIVEKARREF